MDVRKILDNITKYIGDYIASHADRNELLTSYNTIEKIDSAIKNIDSTLKTIDDKDLSDRLKEYKHKKEEEKEPETKICPYCLTEIKYHATRCPNCTSELVDEKIEA